MFAVVAVFVYLFHIRYEIEKRTLIEQIERELDTLKKKIEVKTDNKKFSDSILNVIYTKDGFRENINAEKEDLKILPADTTVNRKLKDILKEIKTLRKEVKEIKVLKKEVKETKNLN